MALLEERATGSPAPADLRRIVTAAARSLGPASPARHVFDRLLLPLMRRCGLTWSVVLDSSDVVVAVVAGKAGPAGLLCAGGWNADLRDLRRIATRSHRHASRWWIGTNGAVLRVLDASRAYTRRSLDFEIPLVADDETAIEALRQALDSSATEPLATLDALVAGSERHRTAVSRSLQLGVAQALDALTDDFTRRRRPVARDAALADALTVIYRVLFLLFAEARGLVPDWHPVYRESYTIESLRPIVESGRRGTGLWHALQAIARLAHRGCKAGTLTVVPFNGRLFSPAAAPLAESLAVDDRTVRDVLLAVTTDRAGDRRARISYADLGVEQLGAVYERVLDAVSTPSPLRPDAPATRKSTGTFYTPRSITEYLVRRTLAPLVRGRSPDRILALRVVDPAMGSGAFLVAACRYLATALEEALIAEGTVARGDLTPADRASFRRTVAARCLYGVDLNPTAVQLARLSLWLCTLAADRPLTFLDHHLRAGNSVAGARMEDMARQPPGRGRRRTTSALSLFDRDWLAPGVRESVERRVEIAQQPDDSAAVVRRKERIIDVLNGDRGPLASWRGVADAWCAAWFWPEDVPRVGPREWPSLSAAIQGRPSGLPGRVVQQWLETTHIAAARERFFHWELEFPEIFFDEHGIALDAGGFDAVIGNPPWTAARALTAFARESGCYPLQSNGSSHANLYQLFAERMLQIVSRGGRVGILVPGGLLADHGCARLREALFEGYAIDGVIGFDNNEGIFPIHRGMKFTLLTATRGGSTTELAVKTGLRSPADLDDVPDEGPAGGEVRVPLVLVRRFSGPGLAVPEFRADADRAIVAKIVAQVPALGSSNGWHVRFGRELNATDDRAHFGREGWPVLEGKLLDPFEVRVDEAAAFIDAKIARRLLGPRAGRQRLAYREVAAATNRLTLIAAMLPADTVSTHTIFCLRDALPLADQWCLCGILNGFVANYLVRLRGGTHVPAAVMHALPAPRPSPEVCERIAAWTNDASTGRDDPPTRARLHAATARIYGLDANELRHVLSTFPLVPDVERAAVLDAFCAETDAI
jgi:N-6 DNA Methylase/Eco57I restriction-modification methylase